MGLRKLVYIGAVIHTASEGGVIWGAGAAEAHETPVEIIFQARNCRSPKSMGIPSIEARITFCLKSMRFNEAI